MHLKQVLSRAMRSATPALWQRLKYRQYLSSRSGEREIHVIDRFVDPTRAALDIGVHLGMYTRHLAKYARSVIGFEANPDSAEFAKRSLHGIATIEWVALSSKAGAAVLRVPLEGANGAEAALGTLSQTNKLGGARYREISVPARRLDDFNLPPVGFIKIDVEGHEEAVLQGGEGLLERDRPVYMVEIEERHNPNALSRIGRHFENRDYRVLFFDGTSMRPIGEFDPQTHQTAESHTYINNFFFLPTEFRKVRHPQF